MASYDPRARADILWADVKKQRRVLRRLRDEKLTLPFNAPPHLRAILEERIDEVALNLAKTQEEAVEAVLHLSEALPAAREPVSLQ